MGIGLLLEGLAIGFAIAAPPGPIGVLCIRRALAHGRLFGLVSGLGAATADAIYGCVAGFGLTSVSRFLIGQQMWLRLFGGAFLLYLAARTFLARPARRADAPKASGLLGAYASILLLTLANPMTIISFAAIFVGLGVGGTTNSYAAAAMLVLGIFCGSALWWVALSTAVAMARERLEASRLRWASRTAGLVLAAFGMAALLSPGH